MQTFTYFFLAAVGFYFGFSWWLKQRHILHVRNHRQAVPPDFAADIPLAQHQKAADYTIAKSRFAQVSLAYETLLLLAWTLGGGLGYLNQWLQAADLDPLWTGVWFIVGVLTLQTLLHVPLSYYSTFVIEQRFGFNKTTKKLFVTDLVKGLVLNLLILVPLSWVVLWIMSIAGSLWWLYVWVVILLFQFFITWAYPIFIAPLFNKFIPLEDAELKARIESLLDECGFKSKGVYVMDGSRRSAHGNAYFAGMGNSKRVVFFDTLLKQLDAAEIEAVLAHELGHFRLKHIIKGFVQLSVLSLLLLAILGWMIDKPWFYADMHLGVDSGNHTAIMLFIMIVPVFTFLLEPLISFVQRKYEFEADNFAARKRGPDRLINALVKLNRENAATVTPDPIHSMIYDSHPPAPVRIDNLKKFKPQPSPA